MKIRQSFLIILMFFSCIVLYGQEKVKIKYDYLLYLPKDYSNSTKKYPLLIYLHGGSQSGNDLNKLKTYGLPYLIDKGANFDFIIASPQCPENKYWSTENWFDSLYSELTARYRIDTNRIYCTGISMGGYGTYIVAMDFPDKFAAIVPLCGGINDSDTSRVCNLRNIPIWTFHGTADDKIPISETERIVNELRKCNGKIKFTRLQNKGHEIEGLYETKPQIYKWLLKHKKTNAGKEVYKSEPLIINRISKHVYQHISFLDTKEFGKVPCNGMIVTNENEAVIFDTPVNDETSRALIDWVTQSLKCKIIAVIPTHYHVDNLGGLDEFHREGIASYAYKKTIQIAKEKGLPAPQHSFDKHLDLKVGNEKVHVEFFGEGHTCDNVVGYFPAENIMFGGCLIKEVGAGKGNLEESNVKEWSKTVKKVKGKYPKVKTVIPGHGQTGGSELLDYTINLFKQ